VGHKKDLVDAFRGSHGVFLVTPIIVPPAAHEAELGKQQADAALEAGVQHIIFSSLENVDKITGGKKWVPHFTDKAKVEEYIRTLPITSSFIYNALFYTNSSNISDPIWRVIRCSSPFICLKISAGRLSIRGRGRGLRFWRYCPTGQIHGQVSAGDR